MDVVSPHSYFPTSYTYGKYLGICLTDYISNKDKQRIDNLLNILDKEKDNMFNEQFDKYTSTYSGFMFTFITKIKIKSNNKCLLLLDTLGLLVDIFKDHDKYILSGLVMKVKIVSTHYPSTVKLFIEKNKSKFTDEELLYQSFVNNVDSDILNYSGIDLDRITDYVKTKINNSRILNQYDNWLDNIISNQV